MAPLWEEMQLYETSDSRYMGACHGNLQADNGWFWKDENGDLDCGIFDWMNFMRMPFASGWGGCLGGASADLLYEHTKGLCDCFASEFERYGGPKIEGHEL